MMLRSKWGFYDTSLDDKKLEEALVCLEGVYRPNDGDLLYKG